MNTTQLLNNVLTGKRMTEEEFNWLYNEGDFLAIGKAADQIRQHRFPGNTASFIIDRNINYTNI
ncbi:MAG: dehypoxanthine futalosine cyclase, partial [Syntrophomonas sp.]